MAQIVSKLKEAKGVKAYDTLQILAKNISQSYLLRLILPFKEVRSVRLYYDGISENVVFNFTDSVVDKIFQDDAQG